MEQPKPKPRELSAELKRLRIRCGLSIPNVVESMRTEYGIQRTRQNLYQHEQGARIPGSQTVAAYCRVYQLNTKEARNLFELAGLVVVFACEEA